MNNCHICGERIGPPDFVRVCITTLPKQHQTPERKSARDLLAVFLAVMKDAGYSPAETKAALRFFSGSP